MLKKEDDEIKIPNLSNRRYDFLNLSGNKPFIRNHTLLFSFLFFVFLVYIIIIFIEKDRKNNIKVTISYKSLYNRKNEKQFFERLRLFLDNDEIFINEMMNKHTTFELGGPAKFFIIPKSINKIIKVLQLCKKYSIDYFILGNGSNLLVSDKGYDGLVIKIHEENFSNLKVYQVDKTNYKITVGGGMLMRTLAKKLCLLSLSGLEDIIDIPGTIGGGIVMNAAAGLNQYLIYKCLDKVKVITPDGEIKEFSNIECQLSHRHSMLKEKKYMVIEATFSLKLSDKMIIQKTMAEHTSKRYGGQPMYFPSAGSFFVWFKPKFGSLYEKYKENNLVGYRVKDAMIYPHNIAFIVNLGNAKSSDVYEIVTYVEKILKDKYDIAIRREVVLLGSFT